MSDAISVLRGWSNSGKLSEVAFSDEGKLRLGETASLTASETVEVAVGGGKTCRYTVGSIFLQLVDVNQSLLAYRKACKKHKVKDAVKAIDKAELIAFFKGGAGPKPAVPEHAREGAAPVSSSKPAPPPPRPEGDRGRDRHSNREDKKRHRSSSERERERDRHRSSKKRELSSSRSSSRQPERKEKAHKPIDPEMLFSNLSVVVGKREIKAKRDAEQAKLHAALSTEGFGTVAKELIAEFRSKHSMAHEIPVGDSASILKAGAGKDLSRILKLYSETMEKKSAPGRKPTSGSSRAKGFSDGQKRSWRPYLVDKKPIIVLPKGMTAPITLVNAHKFFAESQFVSRTVMQKELRTKRQAPKTHFERQVNARFGGGTVQYELMDNPRSKLHRPEDWERVVAVLALGQSWQMKDWPGPYSNPVQLFHRVFGFYVGMEGDNVPKELQGWSVTQTRVSRDKRGLDSVTYASFWNALDEWMAIHKPELLPQPNE
ncbi:unnamed protein product [Pseudo-nitzschia multistriata]|uniref:Cell division control protein 73 C-terminal domain-containing protein n=1 Tax=Pseudo-nitzschia multistriata TaxID=183589 RepID=A0A448Z165_9STRA|nr:unnamed protein product [Pseudo-nitzschia multistriata]